MPDVSIYVALITGAVALAPQAALWAQNEQRSRRESDDKRNGELRQACLDLFRAAAELRVQVENNYHYRGTEMGPRMELVRQRAAEASECATSIALLSPTDLGDCAWRLAVAAGALAAAASASVDDKGRPVLLPGFADMDARLTEFRLRAVAAIRTQIDDGAMRSRRRV
jgi:hypothetical protein